MSVLFVASILILETVGRGRKELSDEVLFVGVSARWASPSVSCTLDALRDSLVFFVRLESSVWRSLR